MTDDIKISIFSYAELGQYGGLFVEMLKARKKAFIDRLGWDLPNFADMEFDQYDSPLSRYVVIHSGTKVLSSVRLIPTISEVMLYSYMVRDAQRGLLKSLPPDLLAAPAPVDPLIWEVSRTFICDDVAACDRVRVQRIYVEGMLSGAESVGAHELIMIMSINWPVISRRFRLAMRAVGDPVIIDTPHQAVMIDVAASRVLARKNPRAVA